MKKRLDYIDNLRWLTVSLLILFHISMAYNTWGEDNYIFLEARRPFAGIVTFIAPWFMPLMFLLAGVSGRYSIRKRGYKSFIKERLIRLGLPLVIGIVVICPVMSYIADVTHNKYEGGFFSHYKVFFTKFTDLTGYDGGFTIGHLWFLAVLIIISILSCLLIKNLEGVEKDNKPNLLLTTVFGVTAIATFNVDIAGKPIIMYFCVYMRGYYLFSNQDFVSKLSRTKKISVFLFISASAANVLLFIYLKKYETLNIICSYLSFIFGIPALFSLGHDYLDFSNKLTRLCSKLSYDFYILHFPIVVLCQYYLLKAGVGMIVNFVLTLLIAYPVTFVLCYVLCDILPPLSLL